MGTKKNTPAVSNTEGMVKLFSDNLAGMAEFIAPDDVKRFQANCMAALTKVDKLNECTPTSFVRAAKQCAMLNLFPGHFGEVYLVPYKQQVTVQTGYKGLIKLALRHMDVMKIKIDLIYKDDHFIEDPGEETITFRRAAFGSDRSDDSIVGALARVWLRGDPKPTWESMTKGEIEEIRKLSKASDGNFWTNHYGRMCCKTVARKLLNGGEIPMSTELQQAIDIEVENEKAAEVVQVREAEAAARKPVISIEPPEVWAEDPEDISSEQEVPTDV